MPAVANPTQHVTAQHHRSPAATHAGESVDALWERYRSCADEVARQLLLRQYVSLVHFVARRMSAKTPAVEYGELVSAGALGLLAALESYEPARGFAFSTYAVARIRGAILDDLRRRDWMPRSSRVRSRRLAAARAQLQAKLQRAPKPSEVADELGLDLQAYWRWCDELDAPALETTTGLSAQGGQTRSPDDPPPPEPGAPEDQLPDRQLLREEEKSRVRAALEQLPEREQRVLALCYYEELTLREVGTLLGVTESRVSQLRQQALRRLGRVLQG